MAKKPEDTIRLTALTITRWVGSLQSIVIHTVIFILSFGTVLLGVFSFDRMLLVLTTILSLEAIYLSLFIQMTVNYTTETIEEVEHDIDEIQEDIDEMQEDVEEIQEDVDEIQEDVEEMSEEDKAEEAREMAEGKTLEQIYDGLKKLMQDVEKLQNKQ
jgi:uncharacterized protein YoxC